MTSGVDDDEGYERATSEWVSSTMAMMPWVGFMYIQLINQLYISSAYIYSTRQVPWAHEHGCPWDEYTCSYAAAGGHLSTLQWLKEHGCPWDAADVRTYAYGHSEVLRWLDEIEQHE